MFFSTDLLVDKNARFAIIWRMAMARGSMGRRVKSDQLIAVNIEEIVSELANRIPDFGRRMTKKEKEGRISLVLGSHLLFGTCLVFKFQVNHLLGQAQHTYSLLKNVRFEKDGKKKKWGGKRGSPGDGPSDDDDPSGGGPTKRPSSTEEIVVEDPPCYGSQIKTGVDYVDHNISASRAFADITLNDEITPISGELNNYPFFISPNNDLVETTDEDMKKFLGDETIIEKESSQNRTMEDIRDVTRDDSVERVRRDVSRGLSIRSGGRSVILDVEPDPHDQSVPGIEDITRDMMPPKFKEGPSEISSQVNTTHQPILPTVPSPIGPKEPANGKIKEGILPPPGDIIAPDITPPIDEPTPIIPDDPNLRVVTNPSNDTRASGGSEDSRGKGTVGITDNKVDKPGVGVGKITRKDQTPPSTPSSSPLIFKNTPPRPTPSVPPVPRKKKMFDDRTFIDTDTMRGQMNDYGDTYFGNNDARRQKESEKTTMKASTLLNNLPSVSGYRRVPSAAIRDLHLILQNNRIILREGGPIIRDGSSDDEDEGTPPKKKLRRDDEDEDERPGDILDFAPRPNDTLDEKSISDKDIVTMEHISVVTIEGDFEGRNVWADRGMEVEDKRLGHAIDKDNEKTIGEGGGGVEKPRKRTTTGSGWDGSQPFVEILEDPPNEETTRDDTIRSEEELDGNRVDEILDLRGQIEKVEERIEGNAGYSRKKKRMMPQVENAQAQLDIMRACMESSDKWAYLDQVIPRGSNAATASRYFMNLLVLTKAKEVRPEQKEAFGRIKILKIDPHVFEHFPYPE